GFLEHAVDGLALRRGSFHEYCFSRLPVRVGGVAVTGADARPLPGSARHPRMIVEAGGERGIRTLEAVSAPTRFPIVLLQPLGHLSTSSCAAKRLACCHTLHAFAPTARATPRPRA